MAKTCPSCGYSAIGPFIDNCPICAEPVRGVASDRAGASGAAGGFGPSSWPPLLVGGWIVLGLILAYLFWGNAPWLLLNLALCGAAWWAVTQGHTLLLRLLGGGLLVLFIPGTWLAAQPSILPGLDQREMSPQRVMQEILAVVQGASQDTLRLRARMHTISGIIYALYAVVVLPLALLVPPLLHYRRRRKLGGPIWLSKPQAIAGLVPWLVLLPLLGWLAWPTMQSWADAPNNQVHLNWPPGQRPGMPPDESEAEPR